MCFLKAFSRMRSRGGYSIIRYCQPGFRSWPTVAMDARNSVPTAISISPCSMVPVLVRRSTIFRNGSPAICFIRFGISSSRLDMHRERSRSLLPRPRPTCRRRPRSYSPAISAERRSLLRSSTRNFASSCRRIRLGNTCRLAETTKRNAGPSTWIRSSSRSLISKTESVACVTFRP